MKQTILTIALLLITLLSSTAAIKKFDANPINIATVMVEKTDSAQVASTCEYYGFAYQGTENGYTVMKRTNGSEIKFSFKENGVVQKYPTIVVKTKQAHKVIEDLLEELSYEKKGKNYEIKRNMYSRFITQCNFEHNNTLIFRRIQNQSIKK